MIQSSSSIKRNLAAGRGQWTRRGGELRSMQRRGGERVGTGEEEGWVATPGGTAAGRSRWYVIPRRPGRFLFTESFIA